MSPADARSPLDALHEARALLADVDHDGAREVVRAIDGALESFPAEPPTGTRRRTEQTVDDLAVLDIVTHDLKDPLSAVLMGAGYLLKSFPDDDENARTRKMAAAIQRSAERMNRLVMNLLEVARIERHRLVLAKHEHGLGELVNLARQRLQPLAAEKGAELVVDVHDEETRVVCDGQRIADAIVHLGSNAVRYTPAGERVAIRARAEKGRVVIEVEDGGPGISGERLTHLFDRYFHMSQTPRDGTGLGLSVAYGVVEAHGGTLRLASTGAGGSVFEIALPR